MEQKTLEEIGFRTGTDKSSLEHDYLYWYDRHLSHLRDKSILVIEIGVYRGASLATWSEYFGAATVVGLDINAEALNVIDLPNTHVRIGDASKLEFLYDVIHEFGRPQLVIDDGSHFWHHQIESFRSLWPLITPGGVFIMEDLHTSFPDMEKGFRGSSSESCYDYLMKLNRWVVGNRQMSAVVAEDGFIHNYKDTIESMLWYRGSCIITKRQSVSL